ncbi:transcription factor grauzone-like isoform X2 [Ochlerotatus camptorhynchus]|uniref:transcription factor grauzone-like isoform X2 n=1 Tax=Ochlerotatus camptorhynchus TaxID=644619 RepID=UPI0031D64C2A
MQESPEDFCLTCLQQAANEDDFQRGFICESCWQQVDSFHRFYSTVEELHGNLVLKSTAVDVKCEPEAEDIEYLDESFMDLIEDGGEIKQEEVSEFSMQDESNDDDDEMLLPVKEETDTNPRNNLKNQDDLKPKRTYCKPPTKTVEERLREDEYIGQHVKYICEQCGEDSETFTLFLKHALEAHGNKSAFVSCCGKRYYKKVRLHQHVQAINNPDAFRCELCQKNYGDAEGIKRHMKEFHTSEAEKMFKCERCDKSFVMEYKYKRHMQDHEDWDSQSCKCEHCGKIYKSRHILKNHIKLNHTDPTSYICDICAKGFHLKSLFLQHKMEHEAPAELKVQCQVCSRWLKNRESWRRHMHQHRGTDAKCDICGHISPHQRALKGHIRRQHSNQKPEFACTYCPKTFSKSITLKEHVAAVHTGVVLYSCPFCLKAFNSHANMHSHKKKMHPHEWQAEQQIKFYSK